MELSILQPCQSFHLLPNVTVSPLLRPASRAPVCVLYVCVCRLYDWPHSQCKSNSEKRKLYWSAPLCASALGLASVTIKTIRLGKMAAIKQSGTGGGRFKEQEFIETWSRQNKWRGNITNIIWKSTSSAHFRDRNDFLFCFLLSSRTIMRWERHVGQCVARGRLPAIRD